MGRGTLASGHPSFPKTIEAVPDPIAERFFILAFAARHLKQGNNANSCLSFAANRFQRLSAGRHIFRDQPTSPNYYANRVPTCAAMRFSFPNPAHTPAKSRRFSPLDGPSPEGENAFAFRNALAAKTAAIVSINGLFTLANRRNIQEGLERFRAQYSHILPGFK